jgi:isopenicillin N synthase-like dioxygenase
MSIPIVDFSRPEAELASEIDRICRDIGFFVLVNHGVPQSTIDRLHELAVEFFDLPIAEKLKVVRPKPELNRGFIPRLCLHLGGLTFRVIWRPL